MTTPTDGHGWFDMALFPPPQNVLGAEIPVLGFMGGTRVVMRWNPDEFNPKPRPFWSVSGWRTTRCRECQPTHWQYLPPPPTES
jgi:hypothetical protein